ncbi:unnamed protein product, partial [marine sediment metagenome]
LRLSPGKTVKQWLILRIISANILRGYSRSKS